MKRPDAPPLKIVVDDGAHLAPHMAQTVFFWFPKIEPRGILIVEDIQPISEANEFRTQFLPQIMKDLHYCGDPKQLSDDLCFPTLFPLLASFIVRCIFAFLNAMTRHRRNLAWRNLRCRRMLWI
jgi:hypothetical protein